jgi:hypothetical protein
MFLKQSRKNARGDTESKLKIESDVITIKAQCLLGSYFNEISAHIELFCL